MKCVLAQHIALARENAQLKAELAQIKESLAHCQALYRKSWTSRSSQACGKSTSTDGGAVPSFMRPTKSSRRRNSNATILSDATSLGEETAEGVVPLTIVDKERYDDGQLYSLKAPTETPHYMRDTHISALRKGLTPDPRTVVQWASMADNQMADLPEPIVNKWATPCKVRSGEARAINWDFAVKTAPAVEADSLRVITRLDDNKFFQTMASNCFVPVVYQQDCLEMALRSAQECLWEALRKHQPEACRRLYSESPRLVKFGFGELSDAGFGDPDCPTHYSDLGASTRSEIHKAIFNVIALRNSVCHPSPLASRVIDDLLYRAQALAVVLHDTERATELRALRDAYKSKVAETYDHLALFVGFHHLPGPAPTSWEWSTPQQRLFASVHFDISMGQFKQYDHVILLATMDWVAQPSNPLMRDLNYVDKIPAVQEHVARVLGQGW